MHFEIRTERKEDTSITRYQALSSWFHYCGLQLIEVQRFGPHNFSFVHHDPESEAPDLELAFFEDGHVTSARQLLKADHEVRRAMREFCEGERRQQGGL